MLPDASGCCCERRPDPRRVGGCRHPRLHDPGRVLAADVGAQPDVGADGEVAAAGRHGADESFEGMRGQAVVGIEERHERRVDEVEAGVAGSAEARPGGVMHHPEARVRRSRLIEDRAGVIGRRVVDEDRDPVIEGLRAERVQRVHRPRCDVETRNDDGDGGRLWQTHPPDCTAVTDAATAAATASSGSR